MVRKGEYLERAVVIPGDPPLEGLYHRGRKRVGVLILPPGPASGGMEVPVVAELAWALTRVGHPTLRLNYPGVGASGGRFSEASALEASSRALEHLVLSASEGEEDRAVDVGFCGVGLGGALAARLVERLGRPADLFVVEPELDALEAVAMSGSFGGGVVVVVAGATQGDRREALGAWVSRFPGGRLMVVPDDDARWLVHLSVVGRAAAEHFSPPGMLEL